MGAFVHYANGKPKHDGRYFVIKNDESKAILYFDKKAADNGVDRGWDEVRMWYDEEIKEFIPYMIGILQKVENDERLWYQTARANINLPLFMIQMTLETQSNTVRDILGLPFLNFEQMRAEKKAKTKQTEG